MILRIRQAWSAVFAAAVLSLSSSGSLADTYKPPEFLFDVSAGDRYDDVFEHQGWYDCTGVDPHFKVLCFDAVTALGETGTYRIRFLDDRAFSAELRIQDEDAMERMVDRLPEWRGGIQTLVEVTTKKATIDIIKAVHDLGRKEALERFSRYLTKDGRRHLTALDFIPLKPPADRQFADAKAYLDSLPPGGVHIRLWRLGANVSAGFKGVSMLSLFLPKADREELFPKYCDDGCANWRIPKAKD